MEIGELIKKARIESGLTQEELGKIVGVQKSAIAKYENGRVVNIKRTTLLKLAETLNLRGSDLIRDEKEQPAIAGELSPKRRAFLDKVMRMSDDELDKLEKILAVVESTK